MKHFLYERSVWFFDPLFNKGNTFHTGFYIHRYTSAELILYLDIDLKNFRVAEKQDENDRNNSVKNPSNGTSKVINAWDNHKDTQTIRSFQSNAIFHPSDDLAKTLAHPVSLSRLITDQCSTGYEITTAAAYYKFLTFDGKCFLHLWSLSTRSNSSSQCIFFPVSAAQDHLVIAIKTKTACTEIFVPVAPFGRSRFNLLESLSHFCPIRKFGPILAGPSCLVEYAEFSKDYSSL